MASADGTGVLIEITKEGETKVPEVYDENLVLPPLQFDLNTSTSSQENLKTDVSSEPEPKEEIFTIEALLSSDIKTLDQEEFDFDLALSPDASQDEDEDEEVFFGPVGFTETCVSAAVEISNSPEYRPMSPLNPSQVAELCKEANFLACRLTALSVSDKKKKPFPKISLKDSIRKSVKKMPNFGKPGKGEEPGLPRVKLDFTSPECQIELNVNSISVTLPAGKLPLSPEGVKLFSADQLRREKKDESLSKPGSKLAPPNSRRSGLQKPSKIGLSRAPSLRAPKRYSPLKRQRTNSLGSDIDTCSTASDVSSASSISTGLPVTTNKRHLPSQKFQPSRSTSKPPSSNPPKPKSNTAAIKSSLAKSSLLKPSVLPNKSTTTCKSLLGTHAKAAPGSMKTGPLKATAPVKRQPSMKDKRTSGIGAPPGKENISSKAMKPPVDPAPRKASGGSTSSVGSVSSMGSVSTPHRSISTPPKSVLTPHRKDKQIQPKCLLPNSCTPVKADKSLSVSSDVSTPASSNRRKSFLPTPKCTPRSASVTSMSKRSPKLAFTPSKMTKKAGAPIMKLVDIDTPNPRDQMPQSAKKPLVMNTPQAKMAAKKPSMWSPIVRRKPSAEEEYITCTKRTSKS
ncbi:G2 and S phase-expressed protein 1-like isoform X2 [Lineus longissimus]|uniref:G2 and S phase-expressed protein 1-like isoform X2 n=1 Tax=Lineus longissimus TaxID=88925 RepID=UPI00315D9C16